MIKVKLYLLVSILALFLLVAGFAFVGNDCWAAGNTKVSTSSDVDDFSEFDAPAAQMSDPLEGLNRSVFTFNHNVHQWFLEPTARVYRKVTPNMFRTGVLNFFNNLLEPTRFINSILQGRFAESGETFLRFMLNSTVGIGGLMDPATYDGMTLNERRFASTLACYRFKSGPYIVLPFYGPSNPRGIFGLIGDTLTSPLFYLLDASPVVVGVVEASKAVNQASFKLGEYEKMLSGTLDPYIAVRNAYEQHQLNLAQ